MHRPELLGCRLRCDVRGVSRGRGGHPDHDRPERGADGAAVLRGAHGEGGGADLPLERLHPQFRSDRQVPLHLVFDRHERFKMVFICWSHLKMVLIGRFCGVPCRGVALLQHQAIAKCVVLNGDAKCQVGALSDSRSHASLRRAWASSQSEQWLGVSAASTSSCGFRMKS